MELNRSLINEPPDWNDAVTRWLKEFPVYLRHDYLSTHNHKLHVQTGIELNLTLEGQGTYVVDKHIWRQSPGQLLIFPGKLPHQVYIDPSRMYTRMVVLIDASRLSSLLPDADFWLSDIPCCQVKLQPDTYLSIKQLLFVMHKEMQERKVGWQQMIVAGLMTLAVTIRRSMDLSPDSESGSSPARRMHGEDPIGRLCEYIAMHLSEDLSLKQMAGLFQLSPDHLIRTFKREKGMTYHKYVLQQRIYESKRLLFQHPDMTLTDIAYQVGFASSSQFSKTFKSMNGLTPSEFRHQP
ncbi:helix-turn-helix domain-containing protein [Paenibacillus ginsengarvi]|uniref:AraC family transcriptional regulator n=1 Tax=Paenibacillus ginsengarvi TaxID=400777 RepID=A0A3B0BCN4_9BACL|nr:AraC family transcriptional regulator [Paenibacillus ginsengarvi]RKN70108.1 AraC family transcriptional regulator [Paenibacillus ginsengarvi]